MLTQAELKLKLSYNPENGLFTRLITTARLAKIGDIAGYKTNKSYIVIIINGKAYKAHRLAWFYMEGNWPNDEIDHINGIKNDNRIINLREATRAENKQNQKNAKADNFSSGLLGVSWLKSNQKWTAQIMLNSKKIYLGTFTDKYKAHAAYLAKKREIHAFGTI